jgi:hypothetical protein
VILRRERSEGSLFTFSRAGAMDFAFVGALLAAPQLVEVSASRRTAACRRAWERQSHDWWFGRHPVRSEGSLFASSPAIVVSVDRCSAAFVGAGLRPAP